MKLESPFEQSASRLIEFSRSLGSAPITPALLERAKWCLLDTLGCVLFGSGQPWSKIVAEEVLAERSQGPCTIYGHGQTLAAAPSALCNGTAAHGFELDDQMAAELMHPGAVVVPAVLAAAEAVDASGAGVLRGIIAGYESMSRLSLAMGNEASRRGFHKTGVVGHVAAAIAAGVAMDLTGAQLSCAVGLACSSASGIKAFAGGSGGGMVKRLHAGRAAEGGVRMSQLARRGFTGPPSAIDGRYGLLEVFGGESSKPQHLWEGLGEKWAIEQVWTKVYPICGLIQGVVQMLMAMRAAQPVAVERVQKVVIGVSEYAFRYNGNMSPSDTMEAQYSIPYCAAVALTGDPADPAAFSLEAIMDPVKRKIIERVELRIDPEYDAVFPSQFASRVQLHLAGGEVKEAETFAAHGTPADPCTTEERIAKFTRLALLSPTGCDSSAVVEAIRNLETTASIHDFTKLLRN